MIKSVYITTRIVRRVIEKLFADEEAYAVNFRSDFLHHYRSLLQGIKRTSCKTARLLNSLISPSEMRLLLDEERVTDKELHSLLHRERSHARFLRDFHVLVHINSLLTNSAQVIKELMRTHFFQR